MKLYTYGPILETIFWLNILAFVDLIYPPCRPKQFTDYPDFGENQCLPLLVYKVTTTNCTWLE